jgi:transcriptional enhancer factor
MYFGSRYEVVVIWSLQTVALHLAASLFVAWWWLQSWPGLIGSTPPPFVRLSTATKALAYGARANQRFLPSLADHFFFTSKGKAVKSGASDSGKSLAGSKDLDATDNLGLHPVIYSLVNENRLPVERPNYEYFAQLLADEQLVSVRPRRCWIFVAHADYVVTAHEAPPDEDGNPGEATFTATNPTTGDELAHPEDYPYLKENAFKDSWPREERAMVPGTLLHQLTKNLEQVESSCVRELSSQWDSDFPELASRLHYAVEESGGELQEPGVPNPSRCEFLHMHLTLELQRRRHFPAQSELNSWVEINVEQPHLLNHRWKVETQLVRPAELLRGENDKPLTHVETEMGVLYVHRPGCEAAATNSSHGCDCLSQRCRRQVVSVPFPADTAARMLTYCAEYPAHPLSPRNDRSQDEAAQGKGRTRGKKNKNVTQMDLLPQIAMCQEIYSCPPELHTNETDPDNKSEGATKTPWKRRAVLLWTFETIHSIQKHQGEDKLVTAPSGRGTWRFLTPLDPTSRQHQQRSMSLPTHGTVHGQITPRQSISMPPGRQLPRDAILSPTPSYQQHLAASMSENFNTVWDNPHVRQNPVFSFNGNQPMSQQGYHPNGQPMYQSSLAPPPPNGPGGLSILASHQHHGGLATPPPTASMNGSFHNSFDSASHQVQEADMRHPSMSFMSVASSGATDSSYLAPNQPTNYPSGVYEEVPQDFQNWVTAASANSLPAVDNRLHPGYWQPQPQYNPASRHVSQSSVLDWAVPSPHDSPITGAPLKPQDLPQLSQQQQPEQQWAPNNNKDHTPVSADTSPRPLTDCSPRESEERQQQQQQQGQGQGQGQWVNVPVDVVAGRTPSTDLSPQEWEVINQSHEGGGGKLQQAVGEGQQLMSPVGSYFPQHQQQQQQQSVAGVQELQPNGHEAQYERFRTHKRRRMFVDDYNMGQPVRKMARTEE